MELTASRLALLVMCSCVAQSAASRVRMCEEGRELEESDAVSLSSCEDLPCKLRRKTSVTIELKFKPPADVEEVTNSVHATIVGIPFPFIGVDGSSICSKIFDAATGAKAACPLKQGQEYVYRDEFKILEIYPKLRLTVQWALKDENDEDIMCFEVPARITS